MRIAKVLAVILLVALGFAAGVKIGVHVGQQQFVAQEGSVKAALLVGELSTDGLDSLSVGARGTLVDEEIADLDVSGGIRLRAWRRAGQ